MSLGTFTVEIDGDRIGGSAETSATLRLTVQGMSAIKDADGDKFKFPSAAASGMGISLPYSLVLPTDVDAGAGVSEQIGYKVVVTTLYGGKVEAVFAAQADGSTHPLTDLVETVVTPIADTQLFRNQAEAAAALAEGYLDDVEDARDLVLAVPATNDGIMAAVAADPDSDFAAVQSAAFARAPIDPRQPAYGAMVDGTTDDTVALRAAVAAAIAQKRPLLIPKGTMLVGTVDPTTKIIVPFTGGLTVVAEAGHDSIVKVKSGTGDYLGVFGVSGSAVLTGMNFDGFTIDQNNAGNPATFTGLTTVGGRGAIVGYSQNSIDVRVRNMKFINFDSINTLVVNGLGADDVVMTDNLFVMGSNTATNHDHSTIYVSAQSMTITGNRFIGVAGGAGALTAIETHGAEQIVTGNRIRDFYVGMNITGIRQDASDNVLVTGNTISDANLGIVLWSGGAGDGLRNCRVAFNMISLDRDVWVGRNSTAYTQGIGLDTAAAKDFVNLSVTHNTIVFKPFAAAALTGEHQSPGIQCWLTSTTVTLINFELSDNLIVGALGSGIRLSTNITRGRIANNRIVDPVSTTEAAMASPHRSGITLDKTLTDVNVFGNRVIDTRGTAKVVQGIYAASPTTVTRCSQYDNTVVCYDGTVLSPFVQNAAKPFATRDDTPLGSRFTTGQYYGPEGNRSTGAQANNEARAASFWVSRPQTFDKIGAQVTVAGAAATVVRLGIYADDGKGRPGALVLDAGIIAGDAVASLEITISLLLLGGLYWLVAVPQGGTPTMTVVSGTNTLGAGVSTLAVATGTAPRMGYTMAGVTGALPATFAVAGQTAGPVAVAVRAA